MAATLGARGGRASKRRPGPLRRILSEVCEEIGTTDNKAVMRYWQKYDIAATADNSSAIHTCWFKYTLYAKTEVSYFLEKKYKNRSAQWGPKPECVERPHDSEYKYFYYDGRADQATDASTIRKTLHRIRCAQ